MIAIVVDVCDTGASLECWFYFGEPSTFQFYLWAGIRRISCRSLK